MTLPLVILVNLNKPPAADVKNASKMTPKFSPVMESSNIDAFKAARTTAAAINVHDSLSDLV